MRGDCVIVIVEWPIIRGKRTVEHKKVRVKFCNMTMIIVKELWIFVKRLL